MFHQQKIPIFRYPAKKMDSLVSIYSIPDNNERDYDVTRTHQWVSFNNPKSEKNNIIPYFARKNQVLP